MRRLIALSALVSGILAVQPGVPAPPQLPLRNLPFAQLNFLHTTDIHGWLGGHLQEGSYSGDWGDYISFTQHLRDRADAEGVDLLVIDTGDRIEGNGLYDSSDPRGLYSFDIYKQQNIDVMTSGNHELYKANGTNDEYHKMIPHYKKNYIASNLDIIDEESGKLRPLTQRYRKFTTKNQGIRIMAMGFLFDFDRSANNTVVQPVEDTTKEQWFQDVIRDKDIDLFLIAGHVALRQQEYELIFKAIREQNWDTPIQFFGGHFHVRDWRRFDAKAYALASGRYMETIGFSSIDGLKIGKKHGRASVASPTFKRRYIDNNLYSLYHHSGKNVSTFDTDIGVNVTKQITKARKALNLDALHGCAPQTYWLDRADLQNNESIFSWLDKQVLPDQLSEGRKAARPKLVLQNTGAIRFDIFEGAFTRDTTYLISPFTSGFRQLKKVDYKTASKLLDVLNSIGPVLAKKDPSLNMYPLAMPEQLAIEYGLLSTVLEDASSQPQHPLSLKPHLTPGYTTKDDDGEDGDDTEHSSFVRYKVPQVMQTNLDFPADDKTTIETVDVIYNGFIEPWVLKALDFLGISLNETNTSPYLEGSTLTTVIADWVEKNWPCHEEFDEL